MLGVHPLAETVRVERFVKAVTPRARLRGGSRRIVSRGGREVTRERLFADRYAPLHRLVWLRVR